METRKRNSKRNKRGMVLPLVIGIAIILAILGFGLLKLGFSSQLVSILTKAEISARSAADAGLAEAMYKMNEKLALGPWDPTAVLPGAAGVTLEPDSSRARYSYSVNGVLWPPYYRIDSTGESVRAVKTVSVITSMHSYWAGIGVKMNVNINSKTEFGTIPPQSDFVFSIRTNSTEPGSINLAPNTHIPGEVVVGPGGDPEEVIIGKSTTTIDGATYAATEYMDFPFKPLPVGLVPSELPAPVGGITTIPAGLYEYPTIIMGAGDEIHIVGDVKFYTPEVRIHNSGVLRVLGTGSLELFVGGPFIADEGSLMINDALDATKLKIFGTPDCISVIIKNSGDFWGAISAPNADLMIHNSGSTYGGFIGNNLDMKNSGIFYFDVRLASEYEDPVYFGIDRWWEITGLPE